MVDGDSDADAATVLAGTEPAWRRLVTPTKLAATGYQ
jgi:hypothetical protein